MGGMFSVGHGVDHITIALSEGFLCFQVSGEVASADIETAIILAVEAGMVRPDNLVLVDIRKFRGSIDWGMIRDMRRYAPWVNASSDVKCAYLVPEGFGSFVTILSSFYPGARHRAFRDETSALRWLTLRRDAA
ncbi:STAS/SEC14 domain-containing protein [Niveispirillum sp.]|uniref:STAS/SEC14 domain-containing protein n=1 Tax=Niveispirillum sp. TaxID=1917217 RepID=UPI001B67595F|nr:STAS/SEC14 domain-containing protein [Niveispirillum sp.]MBP7338718.1 STAS/SEC14 domain-containing protein [Niveispirillum sp.]